MFVYTTQKPERVVYSYQYTKKLSEIKLLTPDIVCSAAQREQFLLINSEPEHKGAWQALFTCAVYSNENNTIHTYANLQIKNKNFILCTVKWLAPSTLDINQAGAKLLHNSSRLQGKQKKVSCEGNHVYKGGVRDKTM